MKLSTIAKVPSVPEPQPGTSAQKLSQFDLLAPHPEILPMMSWQKGINQYLYNFSYKQSRKPKRGDVISYFDLNFKDLLRFQIIS